MDEQKAVKLIQEFEEEWWPSITPGEIVVTEGNDGFTYIWTGVEVESLRVILELGIGKRGGITEEVHAIDTSQQATDRLLISIPHDGLSPGTIIDVRELRARRRRDRIKRPDLIRLCQEKLQEALQGRESIAQTLKVRTLEQGWESLGGMCQGGLRSLGKKRL